MQTILLNYPGVPGEVTLSSYQGLVSVSSLSMKTSSAGDFGAPSYGDSARGSLDGIGDDAGHARPAGTATSSPGQRVGIDSLTITRTVDKATPKFLQLAFATKDDGDTATIVICRAQDSDGQTANASGSTSWYQPFLTITLYDVHISSHELTIGGSDLQEVITISFKELDMEYVVFKNGMNLGSVTCHIDLTGAQDS